MSRLVSHVLQLYVKFLMFIKKIISYICNFFTLCVWKFENFLINYIHLDFSPQVITWFPLIKLDRMYD